MPLLSASSTWESAVLCVSRVHSYIGSWENKQSEGWRCLPNESGGWRHITVGGHDRSTPVDRDKLAARVNCRANYIRLRVRRWATEVIRCLRQANTPSMSCRIELWWWSNKVDGRGRGSPPIEHRSAPLMERDRSGVLLGRRPTTTP